MRSVGEQDASSRLRQFVGNWRLQVRVAACVVVATAFWHWLYPHTFWFLKFWTGMATGAPVGVLWYGSRYFRQLRLRRSDAVLYVLGGAALFFVAVVWVAPDLQSQEAERTKLRSLRSDDISIISIRSGERVSRCEDADAIGSFVERLHRSTLFYPSHEGSRSEFQLSIHLKDGTRLEYNGRVPERHQSDVSLGFRGHSSWSEILVPDCSDWLAKVAPAAVRKR